jgi:hypothetical protein
MEEAQKPTGTKRCPGLQRSSELQQISRAERTHIKQKVKGKRVDIRAHIHPETMLPCTQEQS